MKSTIIGISLLSIFFPSAILAQSLAPVNPAVAPVTTVVSCPPVPYTVANQQKLAEAYVRMSSKIANALPDTPVAGTGLQAVYSNVRQIIAGEAVQGFADVDQAYSCMLKAAYPANKHAFIDALFTEVARANFLAFNAANFETLASNGEAFDAFVERADHPPEALSAIVSANRLSEAEIRAVLKAPNFQSVSTTTYGIVARIQATSFGGCFGTVKATLSTFDNATIAALGSYASIIADIADKAKAKPAYLRILANGKAIYAPGATTQIATNIASAGVNRPALKTCFAEAGATPQERVQ